MRGSRPRRGNAGRVRILSGAGTAASASPTRNPGIGANDGAGTASHSCGGAGGDRGSSYRKRATDGIRNYGSRGRGSSTNRRGNEPSGGDRSASVGGSHHSGSGYGATRHCGGYGYAGARTDGHPGAGGGYRDWRGRNAPGVYHDPC
ncbi:MAG: hypothetical protein OXF79_15765 [Chloroflexi bacterium]|nr:hypothetical protein [Chloroflexota bacterium]